MTPPCCEKCKSHSDHTNCYNYKNCLRWRTWFSSAWAEIQKTFRQEEDTGQ